MVIIGLIINAPNFRKVYLEVWPAPQAIIFPVHRCTYINSIIMNTTATNRNLFVKFIQNFIAKLTQNPAFYNTRHFKKPHRNYRHSQMI